MDQCGVSPKDARTIVSNRDTAVLFDETVARGAPAAVIAKQFVNVWLKLANDRDISLTQLPVDADRMARLACLVFDGTVSRTAANKLAEVMLERREQPDQLARELGLVQVQDTGATQAWVLEAFAANEKAIQDALSNPKKAKKAAGFLRGQVMRISCGKADPNLVTQLVDRRLRDMQN